MRKEELKEHCETLSHILNQPISIVGSSNEVSLVIAANAFHEEEAEGSYLSQIMYGFIDYPGPTETLIRELELICDELEY